MRKLWKAGTKVEAEAAFAELATDAATELHRLEGLMVGALQRDTYGSGHCAIAPGVHIVVSSRALLQAAARAGHC